MTSPFKKRHLSGLAAFAAACALTLSACGGGDAPKDNAGDKPEAGPPAPSTCSRLMTRLTGTL